MDLPPMPARCQAIFYCPRRARQWLLMVRGPVAACRWHFRVMDRLTRTRRVPEIVGVQRTNDPTAFATIDPRMRTLFVTRKFAEASLQYQVFVLSHEEIHIWLQREFGLATSLGFDLIYERSMHALSHHSIKTWTLNDLYLQNETTNL
jgi:hypothetical protein